MAYSFDEFHPQVEMKDKPRPKKKHTTPPPKPKYPDYPETLLQVRQQILKFQSLQRKEPFCKESIARKLCLQSGFVQRALGALRIEGLVSQPVRNANHHIWPRDDQTNVGWSAEYYGWNPTSWFIRLKGYRVPKTNEIGLQKIEPNS